MDHSVYTLTTGILLYKYNNPDIYDKYRFKFHPSKYIRQAYLIQFLLQTLGYQY